MKTILIFVSTLDGKVTKWGASHVKSWTSKEDQIYYDETVKQSHLIVMGSNTFISGSFPSTDSKIVVMTGHPDKYKGLKRSREIEFTNESPAELRERFQVEGYGHMLVVGGPQVATSFLKQQLIDELWLTLEPKIFGMGTNFALDAKLDIELRLLHFEKVNEQGTLITKYSVIRKEELH